MFPPPILALPVSTINIGYRPPRPSKHPEAKWENTCISSEIGLPQPKIRGRIAYKYPISGRPDPTPRIPSLNSYNIESWLSSVLNSLRCSRQWPRWSLLRKYLIPNVGSCSVRNVQAYVQTLTAPGGGIGYNGPTDCVSGYTCQSINDWYSQCRPGTVTSVVPTPPASTPHPTPPESTPPPTQPSSASPASCPSPGGTSLDAKIKAKGRDYFGTCTDKNTLSDPAYEAIVIAEYGQVTPENSMKWESTESESPSP